MNINKDCEPHRSEGFILKTSGSSAVSTVLPDAYLYARFAIAAGNNKFTLKARNFSANATFFKLAVIKDDGTVSYVVPTASVGSAAANSCWQFVHQSGGGDDPDGYASFVYDLSAFNGNNVVLALGVYKGASNADENKLCIYTMDLN
jgi:hypothetical protein